MPEPYDQVQTISCRLDPARAAAMQAAMGHEGPPPGAGDALPRFWHHLYFWDPVAPGQLGRDGHPRVGTGLIPDMGLPRRMWAEDACVFHHDLRLGTPATRRSHVAQTRETTGRSGRLAFVSLVHEISQDDRLCLTETQTLVYRDPPGEGRPATVRAAPDDEDVAVPTRFSPTLLFRYSALTFNGHRIHYDADYALAEEGYDGLVVHGPLLGQMLLDLLQARVAPAQRYRFAARAPVIVDETVTLCVRADGYGWVRGADGRLCVEAWLNASGSD